MLVFSFDFYMYIFLDMGDQNPFRTFCDDEDEDEDVSDCSLLTDDI